MAGVEHLERMGRELKCPICLSLLQSAVSLTCNHVFCNSCISKSMKSASNCPVCKVPYHRREVRPSPHMDNLVTVYKSMEAAAGVNIFVTQREPGNKTSDESIHSGDGKSHDSQEAKGKRHRKGRTKIVLKNKSMDEKIAEATVANPGLSMASFPSKKRVHVTPYPISETPLKSEKLPVYGDPSLACQTEMLLVNNEMDKTRNIATAPREKFSVDEKGEPMFNPFFWLRDDVDEDEALQRPSTQQADNLPPLYAPCFSDIKDTDDGNLTTMTPVSKPYAERIFDSELFEWTQRPCSPELCFTPTRNQTADEDGLDKAWQKEHETALLDRSPGGKGILLANSMKASGGDQATEHSDDCDNPRKQIAKRKQKANLTFQKKSVKRSVDTMKKSCMGASSPLVKSKHSGTAENSCPGSVKHQKELFSSPPRRNKKVRATSNYKFKHGKKLKDKSQDYTMAEAVVEQLPTERAETEAFNLEMDDEVVPSPKAEKDYSNSERGKRKRNAIVQTKGRKRKMSFDDAVAKILEEVPQKTSNERETVFPAPSCQNIELNSGLNSLNRERRWEVKGCNMQQKSQVTEERRQNQMADKSSFTRLTAAKVGRKDKYVDSGKGVDENVEKNQLQRKKRREQKGQAKVTDWNNLQGPVEDSEERSPPPMSRSVDRSNKTTSKLQQNGDSGAAKGSSMALETLRASGHRSSKNCNNLPSHIRCVFCRSDKETEVTGDMVHYFNGKPVASGCNGGKNVIHSHKHCAEWAPNVYFQDDSAVNLANEIARSKRIKCSCCGIKGAALGCFETSCRKSFHYTCAKLTPQCRWDTENFVMLCPLHQSSKLPFEIPESQRLRQKQSTQKRECQPQATIKSQASMRQLWRWPSGSPVKWVLCCSSLSNAEKETVSEFAKVAGVPVLKNWSPTVTHVIASTDENGACKRTLKFLMAIMEGKWILKMDWVRACMKAGEPFSEEQYEIRVDVYGIRDGPKLGRLRAIKQEPKLFNGFKFYFSGDFTTSYKGYLQDLVIAAGGTVLQRKPVSREKELDDTPAPPTFVIYSLELDEKLDSGHGSMILNCRKAEAGALAAASGANVATNTWILDSIAACKMRNLDRC